MTDDCSCSLVTDIFTSQLNLTFPARYPIVPLAFLIDIKIEGQ